LISERTPFSVFNSIQAILAESSEEEPLAVAFWEQSDVPSPWTIVTTEAAAMTGGLELDDSVFGNCWTGYWGAHTRFDCDPELHGECERHNCLGTHSMEGHGPAVVETVKSGPVQSIVSETSTPTPSKINAYKWRR